MANEFEIPETLRQISETIMSRNTEMIRGRSDLQLRSIIDIIIKAARWSPLRAGNYIPLPPFLSKKHAIINVKSDDEKCFAYAIAAYKLFNEFQNKDSKTVVSPATETNKSAGTLAGENLGVESLFWNSLNNL